MKYHKDDSPREITHKIEKNYSIERQWDHPIKEIEKVEDEKKPSEVIKSKLKNNDRKAFTSAMEKVQKEL